MEMLRQGHSLNKISKTLGIPKSTLSYWKNNRHRPPETRWTPKPTPELAYIIGVLHGDGYTRTKPKEWKYIIGLECKDYEFAVEFSKALAKILNKPFKTPKYRKTRNIYRITYESRAFYNWWTQQTLQTLKPYIEHNRETVVTYLRGFYDSEENNNIRNWEVNVFNSDKRLLEYIKYLQLKYFNIEDIEPNIKVEAGSTMIIIDKAYTKRKDVYQLKILGRYNVTKFLTLIEFSIKEKQYRLRRRKYPQTFLSPPIT